MPRVQPAGTPWSEDFAKSVGMSRSDLDSVVASAIFDERFYLMTYSDVAEAAVDPLAHYLAFGRFERRKPSAIFDPVAYIEANPEVATLGMEPFLHYVLVGHVAGAPLSKANTILPRPAPAPVSLLNVPVTELQATHRRLDVLERSAAEVQAAIGRLEVLERRAALVETSLNQERGRIDWALGAFEGVTAQIDAYHADRETNEYRAAYAAVEPLVSVCVTTMDRMELLLERSIGSLLTQSYRNLQIVVVGDNCVDDTMRRLAALGDSRIQFVNLPERGPYPRPGIDRWYVAGSNAINYALSLCEGKFITHLDDDDKMVPHRIEAMLAAAQQHRADFLWHPFWYENSDGTWVRLGNGRLECGQITTGSIFYHSYFARFPWDVHAYRLEEPGDWNRVRKIRLMRPRLHYLDEPLLYHYAEQSQPTFVARDGERFLE